MKQTMGIYSANPSLEGATVASREGIGYRLRNHPGPRADSGAMLTYTHDHHLCRT